MVKDHFQQPKDPVYAGREVHKHPASPGREEHLQILDHGHRKPGARRNQHGEDRMRCNYER